MRCELKQKTMKKSKLTTNERSEYTLNKISAENFYDSFNFNAAHCKD